MLLFQAKQLQLAITIPYHATTKFYNTNEFRDKHEIKILFINLINRTFFMGQMKYNLHIGSKLLYYKI